MQLNQAAKVCRRWVRLTELMKTLRRKEWNLLGEGEPHRTATIGPRIEPNRAVAPNVYRKAKEWRDRRRSWWRGSVVRASVFDWRTFPDMRQIYGWRVTTSWVRRPLWVNQPDQHSLLPSLGPGMSSISVDRWVKLLAAVRPQANAFTTERQMWCICR